MLHAALEIVDLEFLTPLRHQLVLIQTRVVAHSVLLALVEMVEREGALVRRNRRGSVSGTDVCGHI